MARLLETGGVVLGLAIVIVGIAFQIAGMSAWVYCSVIGGGAVLLIAAGGIWLIQGLRHGKPGAVAG